MERKHSPGTGKKNNMPSNINKKFDHVNPGLVFPESTIPRESGSIGELCISTDIGPPH